jgi:hypothetical protein
MYTDGAMHIKRWRHPLLLVITYKYIRQKRISCLDYLFLLKLHPHTLIMGQCKDRKFPACCKALRNLCKIKR